MILRYIGLCLALLATASCSSEKVTLSPLYNSVADGKSLNEAGKSPQNRDRKAEIFYASELVNHLSTMPKFTNDALNREVGVLKFNVKEFVYAVEAYNLTGRERSLANIAKSYRKIQKMRSFLHPDENEVINRYLVRIKSNINNLEALTTAKP